MARSLYSAKFDFGSGSPTGPADTCPGGWVAVHTLGIPFRQEPRTFRTFVVIPVGSIAGAVEDSAGTVACGRRVSLRLYKNIWLASTLVGYDFHEGLGAYPAAALTMA